MSDSCFPTQTELEGRIAVLHRCLDILERRVSVLSGRQQDTVDALIDTQAALTQLRGSP